MQREERIENQAEIEESEERENREEVTQEESKENDKDSSEEEENDINRKITQIDKAREGCTQQGKVITM